MTKKDRPQKTPTSSKTLQQGSAQQGTAARPQPHPVYLSPNQVAELYGVNRQWPYRCKDLQKYKLKIGGLVRFRLSDLEKFEQERVDRHPRKGYPTNLLVMRRKHKQAEMEAEQSDILFLM